jgi:hypothetical protein
LYELSESDSSPSLGFSWDLMIAFDFFFTRFWEAGYPSILRSVTEALFALVVPFVDVFEGAFLLLDHQSPKKCNGAVLVLHSPESYPCNRGYPQPKYSFLFAMFNIPPLGQTILNLLLAFG